MSKQNKTKTKSTIRQDIWNVPNLLTMGRIVLIPVICILLIKATPAFTFYATLLFGLAGFTDWLDGYIARKQGLVSLTGKFLDPLADKLLILAVFITTIKLGWLPVWFVILSISREVTITSLRAMAASEGMIIAAGKGGKMKTAFQIVGLIAVMLHFEYQLDYLIFKIDVRFDRVGFVLLLISLVFSLASGFGYFKGFLDEIDRKALPEIS